MIIDSAKRADGEELSYMPKAKARHLNKNPFVVMSGTVSGNERARLLSNECFVLQGQVHSNFCCPHSIVGSRMTVTCNSVFESHHLRSTINTSAAEGLMYDKRRQSRAVERRLPKLVRAASGKRHHHRESRPPRSPQAFKSLNPSSVLKKIWKRNQHA